MPKGTCTDPGCVKPVYAKGLCGMHYQRARQAKPGLPTCSVPNCTTPVYALKLALCRRHYNARHDARVRDTPERREQHRLANLRYVAKPETQAAIHTRRIEFARLHPDVVRRQREGWRAANVDRTRQLRRENQAARKARQHGNGFERVDYGAIIARDGMVCHICGLPIASRADLHFDHVIPLAKGGPHMASNIRPAHALCNMRKHDHIL